MSDDAVLFSTINYSLKKLLADIDIGEIRLPDLQRPLVWKPVAVRDLLDSMYKGFPVGHILLWKNESENRPIGAGEKQKKSTTVIVDGQQRLTSLYSVFCGKYVINKKFEELRIKIAFNPKEQKFAVLDAIIRRDPEWLPDISVLWKNGAYTVIKKFVDNLKEYRRVAEVDELTIATNINRLHRLEGYHFIAHELNSEVDPEIVARIFERLNSKGTKLNQPDYILTLMSVFWPEGREDLRKFSRECMKPPKTGASPYNHFIKPLPNQLIRIITGLGFKRGVLRYCYSILGGKDLETGQVTQERRDKQFKILKKSQSYALDLQRWADFMKVLLSAGFRSEKMITSANTILFSYVIFLIGKRDFRVPDDVLREVMARWFFMSSIRGRYTTSIETVFEQDLARFRGMKGPKDFVDMLDKIISAELTDDFWNVTLPNSLNTSSNRSPYLLAYFAALNLLEASALFSKMKISDLTDPSQKTKKSNVEIHHLFPKEYLKSIGFKEIKIINQIANYAYLEWKPNSEISDDPPSKYYKKYKSKVTDRMLYLHALPDGWQRMKYEKFLDLRRKKMAEVIRNAYEEKLAYTTEYNFVNNC